IKKSGVVRFQVHYPASSDQRLIHIQKFGGGKSFFLVTISRAWIRKSNPQFIYFPLIKKLIQHLDLASQEGDVIQSFCKGDSTSLPYAGTLDVYTYEIPIGILLG